MMNATRLPPITRPLSRLAARLPHPGSAFFASVLNVALLRDLPEDVYLRLIGRHVEIVVSDWDMRLRFVVTPERFSPLPPNAAIDLAITASARDFARLAAGDDDADTLYFDRRIVVEGDTELALLVKNTLDALAAPRLRAVIRAMHRGLSGIRVLGVRRGIGQRARV